MKLYQKIGFTIIMKHAKNQIKIPSICFFMGPVTPQTHTMYTGVRSENGTNAI